MFGIAVKEERLAYIHKGVPGTAQLEFSGDIQTAPISLSAYQPLYSL